MIPNRNKNTRETYKKPISKGFVKRFSKGMKHLLAAFHESGAHKGWVCIPHQTLGSRAAGYHDNKKAYTRWFPLRTNPELVALGLLEMKKQPRVKINGIWVEQPFLYRLTTKGSLEAKHYHQEFIAKKAEKSAILYCSKKITLKTPVVIKNLKLLERACTRAHEEPKKDLINFTRKYKDDACAIDILKSFKNLTLNGRYSLLRFPSKALQRVVKELSSSRNIGLIYKRCKEVCLEEGFYPDHDFARKLIGNSRQTAFRPLIEIYFDDVQDKKKKRCVERKKIMPIRDIGYVPGSIRSKELDEVYKNAGKWKVIKTDRRSLMAVS